MSHHYCFSPPSPTSVNFFSSPPRRLALSFHFSLPTLPSLSLLTCPVSSPSSCHFQRLTLSFSVPYPAFCGQFYLLSSVSVFLLSPDSPSCLYRSSASHRFSHFVKATLHHSCFSQFLSLPPTPAFLSLSLHAQTPRCFPSDPAVRGRFSPLPSPVSSSFSPTLRPSASHGPAASPGSPGPSAPPGVVLCSLRSGSRLFRALSKHAQPAGLGVFEYAV